MGLSQLPNIGKELERRLNLVEIHTAEELNQVGSLGVLQRLGDINHPVCVNMLYALEGAIQGIRWHYLPDEVKTALKSDLKDLQSRVSP